MKRTAKIAFLVALVLPIALASMACSQDPAVKKQKLLSQAQAYLAKGKVNEAVIELQSALQIDSNFAPALYTLGQAYRAKFWYLDATAALQRAVELQPENVSARVELGKALVDIEAWNDVSKQGEKVLSLDPKNADAPYLIGVALQGKGQAKEALDFLSK